MCVSALYLNTLRVTFKCYLTKTAVGDAAAPPIHYPDTSKSTAMLNDNFSNTCTHFWHKHNIIHHNVRKIFLVYTLYELKLLTKINLKLNIFLLVEYLKNSLQMRDERDNFRDRWQAAQMEKDEQERQNRNLKEQFSTVKGRYHSWVI